MSNPFTIPMLDPTGTVRAIPSGEVDKAKKAGGKIAVKMLDPEGTQRWIPSDRVSQAQKAGGKFVPFGSQSEKEVVQQETGITPFSETETGKKVGQTVSGAVEAGQAVGRFAKGIITSPIEIYKAATNTPTNPEEKAAKEQWGHLGLLFDRMVVQPEKAGIHTSNELFRASQNTRTLAKRIDAAANNPKDLEALKKQFPQLKLNSPQQAKKAANNLTKTAIGLYMSAIPAAFQGVPILGATGAEAGTRAAAGDITGAVTEGALNAVALGAPSITAGAGELAKGVGVAVKEGVGRGITGAERSLTGLTPEDTAAFARKHVEEQHAALEGPGGVREKATAEGEKIHDKWKERRVKQKADYDAEKLAAEKAAKDAQGAHEAKLEQLKYEYDQSVKKTQEKYAGDKAKIEEGNADAVREYNKKVGKAIEKNKAIQDEYQARKNEEQSLEVKGSQMMTDVKKLESQVHDAAKEKFNAVAEKVGTEDSVPQSDLKDAADEAAKKWVRGKPEKIKEFEALTQRVPANSPELLLANQTAENLGYRDFSDAIKNPQIRDVLSRTLPKEAFQAGLGEVSKGLNWNDLQGFYEETGSQLARGIKSYGGGLDGDVYQALKQFHDAVGDRMREMAERHGAGEDLAGARKYYKNFMDTFHDPTGGSGSGSPVSQALRAEDPYFASKPFTGPSSVRGIRMLRQYSPELADLADGIRQTRNRLREIGVKTTRARTNVASIPKPVPEPLPTEPTTQLRLQPPKSPPKVQEPLPPVLEPEPPKPEEYAAQKVEEAKKPLTPEMLQEQKLKKFNQRLQEWRGVGRYQIDRMVSGALTIAGGIFGLLTGLFGTAGREASSAGIAIGARDFVWALGGRAIAKLLDSDVVRAKLTKVTPQELKELMKLPADQRAGVEEALDQLSKEAIRQKKIKSSQWPGVIAAMRLYGKEATGPASLTGKAIAGAASTSNIGRQREYGPHSHDFSISVYKQANPNATPAQLQAAEAEARRQGYQVQP